MYVQSNMGAIQAAGYLQQTTDSLNKTLAQLSSGYQITSAADNPAGLAISQQMQSQIDGMQQAYQNASEGTSFLQTADGALSQIQNILQSMYSLATQAANGTNVGVDRGAIQSQMDQYAQEINSITNQTSFNTKNLLDGVLGNVNLAIGPDPNQNLQFTLSAADAKSLGVAGQTPTTAKFGVLGVPAGSMTGLTLFGANSTTNPYGSYSLTGTNYNIEVTAAAGAQVNGGAAATAAPSPSSSTATGTEGKFTAGGIVYGGTTTQTVNVQVTTNSGATGIQSVAYSTDGGSTYTTVAADGSGNYVLGSTGLTLLGADIGYNTTGSAVDTYTLNLTPASATFQLEDSSGNKIGAAVTQYGIGALAGNTAVTVGDANNGQAVQFNYNSALMFGEVAASYDAQGNLIANGTAPAAPLANDFSITYTSAQSATGSGGAVQQQASVTSALSVMNYTDATNAQTAIQNALNQIAGERAQVGSLMDRLNQASQDLSTSQQNLQNAQAGILDVNVAVATAKLSQEQVLQQAGVAMLSTANNTPAALLKLLP